MFAGAAAGDAGCNVTCLYQLKEVHRMVEIVKVDAETTISCARLMEKLERSLTLLARVQVMTGNEGKEGGATKGC